MTPLHGIGSRSDLPLPFWLVITAAAIILVVSVVIVAYAWQEPKWQQVGGKHLPRLQAVVWSPAITLVGRLAALLIFGLAWLGILAGQDLLTNPAFGYVFVLCWVGLVPVSLLLGNVWQSWNVAQLIPVRKSGPLDAGVWPAAVALFAFEFFELVQPDRATLPVLRVWAILWLIWVAIWWGLMGRHRLARFEPFAAYAKLLSQLAPWHGASGRLLLVNPMRKAATWKATPGTWAVGVVLLAGTAFDSLSSGSTWVQFVQNSDLPRLVWDTLGLIGVTAIVAASFTLAARLTAPAKGVVNHLGSTLAPIVAGYAFAHYGTLLLLEGQRTLSLLSDPLGRGWNLLGTSNWAVNASLTSYPTLIASLQVLAIIAGHVLGVILAHERTLQLTGTTSRGAAIRSQIPMTICMVGYTICGLLLLFAA